MPDLDALKAEAKRVLDEGIVEIVIGFKAGDTPLHPQPAFFRSAAEVDQLVYGALCQNNLATYLTRQPKTQKIGMLVRGCENRSVNALAFEGQHARENLYLIGIPCEGIIDWRKIVDQTGEEVISVVEQSDNTILVEAMSGYYTLEKASVLHESCARCIHPNPVSAMWSSGNPCLKAILPWLARKSRLSRVYQFSNALPGSARKPNAVSVVMPAAKPARCATARSVSWTISPRVGPKAALPRRECRAGISCELFIRPGDAPVAELVNAPAQWISK